MNKRKTTNQFIKEAQVKHNNFYGYKKVFYKNNYTPITITCPVHGDFEKRPSHHLTGSGCPSCLKCHKRKTTTQFIKEAQAKHNNFYGYDKAVYITNRTSITITCPVHGDFEQRPSHHLKGSGCKCCSDTKRNNDQKDTVLSFVEKANIKHKNHYGYDKVIYISSSEKVKITCPVHGDFEQIPNSHLRGSGCPSCGVKNTPIKNFIKRCQKIHNNFYNYDKVLYNILSDKVTITCPVHGDFEQNGNCHLRGQGCPSCGNTKSIISKYKDKQTTIYYIYFPEFNLYKIGLTQSSIKRRYEQDNIKIETISTKIFKDGSDALKLEQNVLKYYKKYQYKGKKILKGGNTELFTEDVLSDFYK